MSAVRYRPRGWVLGLAAIVGLTVWLVSPGTGTATAPVVPSTESRWSLDLEVVGHVDHDLVYAVEQRARPNYRILSIDPASGDVQTVFTVPDDSLVHGIALSPDRDTLAVAYSTSLDAGGNGLWLIDLNGEDSMVEVVPAVEGVHLVDPVWTDDGDAVLLTQVTQATDDQLLQVVLADLGRGTVSVIADNAVDPAVVAGTVHVLAVDDDGARQTVATINRNGDSTEVLSGDADLDHLLGNAAGDLTIAAIVDDAPAFTVGTSAAAHGDHTVPVSWWTTTGQQDVTELTAVDPIVVYDAAATDDGVVMATLEGIRLVTTVDGSTQQIDLVSSRAMRLVAG